jgi:hypothetical protein
MTCCAFITIFSHLVQLKEIIAGDSEDYMKETPIINSSGSSTAYTAVQEVGKKSHG